MSKIASKTLARAMLLQEKRLAITASSLANANTSGYKAIEVSCNLREPVAIESRPHALYFILCGSLDAALVQTGAGFDVAIQGRGFFVMETAEDTFYTRKGALATDPEKRLITSDGGLVTGKDGELIVDGMDMTIHPDGSIYANGQNIGALKVVDFNDKALLEPVGSGLFKYGGEESGVVAAEGYSVKHRFLESSNVNVMHEVVDLIHVQRTFEAYEEARKMDRDTSTSLLDMMPK